jgi:hypothetical protein
MLLFLYPAQYIKANTASSATAVVSKNNESTAVKEQALRSRLNEIFIMDKSNLKPSDKKVLRNEVNNISRQLKTYYGSVIYISGGTLLVIILILILLL